MSSDTQQSEAATLEQLAFRNFVPELLNSSIQRADFEHYLGTPGPFDGSLLHVSFEDLAFDSGTYSRMIYARGKMSPDTVTLGLASVEQPDGLVNGSKMEGTILFAYSETQELETKLPASTQWFGLQVPRTTLENAGIDFPNTQAGLMPAKNTPLLARLDHTLKDALSLFSESAGNPHQSGQPEALLRSQLQGIYAAFLSTMAFGSSDDSREYRDNHRTAVMKSRDYMEAHLGRTISVGELCKESGLSIRNLERAFNSITGMPPQRYLRMLRLSRARQMLQTSHLAETSVSEIAIACGSFHLGRFSQDYRVLFGERPSHTLNRCS